MFQKKSCLVKPKKEKEKEKEKENKTIITPTTQKERKKNAT